MQLANGSEVVVRPIGPDDAPLLQAFVRRLSARSRRFRFFVALAELSAAQLDRFVNVDPDRGLALVALSGRQEGTAIVAEARYALAQEDDNAEFAIAVADDFQRRGLGEAPREAPSGDCLAPRRAATVRRDQERQSRDACLRRAARFPAPGQPGGPERGCRQHGLVDRSILIRVRPLRDPQRLRRKECDMIGVFVTFRYGDNFDERAVRKIAETARVRFEGMPGLRSKAFTLNSGKREAANFYVWDSEEAAKAFFTDELLERVAGLYGVRPSIEFVQIATLVENIRP